MTIKQATIRQTAINYRGEEVNLYSVTPGEIMILSSGRASGLVAENYKKATLREAAEKLGVDRVTAMVEYKGRGATAIYDRSGYSIWSNGDCLFSDQ